MAQKYIVLAISVIACMQHTDAATIDNATISIDQMKIELDKVYPDAVNTKIQHFRWHDKSYQLYTLLVGYMDPIITTPNPDCPQILNEFNSSYVNASQNIDFCIKTKLDIDAKQFIKRINIVHEKLDNLKQANNGPSKTMTPEYEDAKSLIDEIKKFVAAYNLEKLDCHYEETLKQMIHSDLVTRVAKCLETNIDLDVQKNCALLKEIDRHHVYDRLLALLGKEFTCLQREINASTSQDNTLSNNSKNFDVKPFGTLV